MAATRPVTVGLIGARCGGEARGQARGTDPCHRRRRAPGEPRPRGGGHRLAVARQAGVPLQVGFNRRWDQAFAEGHAAIDDAGKIGTPQLLRSLTRDPGLFGDASGIPPGPSS